MFSRNNIAQGDGSVGKTYLLHKRKNPSSDFQTHIKSSYSPLFDKRLYIFFVFFFFFLKYLWGLFTWKNFYLAEYLAWHCFRPVYVSRFSRINTAVSKQPAYAVIEAEKYSGL